MTLADICPLFLAAMGPEQVCRRRRDKRSLSSKVCLSPGQVVFIWRAGINTSLCIVLLSVCVLKNCIFHTEAVQCKRRCVINPIISSFSFFFSPLLLWIAIPKHTGLFVLV